MAFGLLQMFLERLGKLLVRRGLGHLWERPCELGFGAVKILQFVYERVMECFDFHNSSIAARVCRGRISLIDNRPE